MLALGDGAVDRGSYAGWRTSTSTYSSTRSSREPTVQQRKETDIDEMM
jgi:hypothetical protein